MGCWEDPVYPKMEKTDGMWDSKPSKQHNIKFGWLVGDYVICIID